MPLFVDYNQCVVRTSSFVLSALAGRCCVLSYQGQKFRRMHNDGDLIFFHPTIGSLQKKLDFFTL